MRPSDQTISILQARERWTVAAIECVEAVVLFPDTRSQKMRFTASLLVPSSELPSPWEGDQWVADQALLRPGVSFVVIAIYEQEPDGSTLWKIIQAEELSAADPADAVAQMTRAIREALGSQ